MTRQSDSMSVDEVQPGDYRDIDSYLRELREAGYDAEYENLWDGTSGFFAELSVNGTVHAYFDGRGSGHLVKDVETPLKYIQ